MNRCIDETLYALQHKKIEIPWLDKHEITTFWKIDTLVE